MAGTFGLVFGGFVVEHDQRVDALEWIGAIGRLASPGSRMNR